MPYDILFCYGEKCPLKENCLRFTGIAYGRRDFFGKIPYDFKSDYCEHFWDDRPSDEKTRQFAYKLWPDNGYQPGRASAYWFQAQKQLIDTLRSS